jgi:hypothetical protein
MSSVNSHGYVTVPVTTLWASPTAPRDVDGWALAPRTDVVAWLADLDAAGARPGLLGPVLTQLEHDETVLGSVIIEEALDHLRLRTLIGAGRLPSLSSPARNTG